MRHYMLTSLIAASLLISACGKKEPDQPVKPLAGREETRGIRNADAIGYSGSAIADKVDGALNANDQQKARLDQTLQGSE